MQEALEQCLSEYEARQKKKEEEDLMRKEATEEKKKAAAEEKKKAEINLKGDTTIEKTRSATTDERNKQEEKSIDEFLQTHTRRRPASGRRM